MPELTDEEAMAQARQIYLVFLHGIVAGSEVKITYSLNQKPTVQDLAGIEKAINGFISGILRRDFKMRVPQRAFRLDLTQYQHLDDGRDNDVIVTLDFAKMIPGERPPELLALAARLDAEAGA